VKHRVFVYVFFLVASTMLISFCSRPKEVLSKKEMEKLLYDIYIAEALIESDYATFDTPEKKEAFIQQVFRKHGITEAQWDTSLSWYADHIDIYLKINDSVKARILRQQKNIEQQIAQQHSHEQEIKRKTQSPSYIPQLYVFDFMGTGTGFSFRLDTAEISKQINQNNFDFRFDVIGLSQQNPPRLISMLILEYADTTLYKTQSIAANQTYSMTASKYIPNDTLRQLSGFIHLQDRINLFKGIQLYNIHLGNKDNFQQTNKPLSHQESKKQ